MRVGACLATEAGVQVCCSVHDAYLALCAAGDIEATKSQMTAIMQKAGHIVLGESVTLRNGPLFLPILTISGMRMGKLPGCE